MSAVGIERLALVFLASSAACTLPQITVVDDASDVIVAMDASDMTTAFDSADAPETVVAVDADANPPDVVMCTPMPNCGPAVSIAARGSHTCAARAGGAVLCWGGGPLGDNTMNSSLVPVVVMGIPSTERAVRVAASNTSSCALMASGSVYCWGSNGSGECGDGATVPFPQHPTAVAVVGLPSGDRVQEIGMGNNHTCARTARGDVYCWGSNGSNQLSPMNDLTMSSRPVRQGFPNGGVPASQLSVGFDHNCVLSTGATVWCWGYNTASQVGQPTSMGAVPTPTSVNIGGSVTVTPSSVAAGGDFTCVVDLTNGTFCWGSNALGQLGVPVVADSSNIVLPADVTTVMGLINIDTVAAGAGHVCGVSTANPGVVQCWGANFEGQLGDSSMNNSPNPLTVRGIAAGAAVAAGNDHSCAIQSDGSIVCWGSNRVGQLGNGMMMARSTIPVPVVGFP